MVPTDDLFKLIKSMSKNEKRFFKLHSGIKKNDKKYLLLFDAIEKQKNYDEKKIKTLFDKENFLKQFPVAKSDVYSLILKSMSLYHSNRTIDFKLREGLNQIEVLFFKGLLQQCLKSIKKYKKLAETFQKYSILVEILRWERKVLSLYDDNISSLAAWPKENSTILSKLISLNKYQSLVSEVWLKYTRKGKARELREKKEFQHIFGREYKKARSEDGWEAQWQYGISAFMYYRAIGNYKKAYAAIKNSLMIMEHNPIIIKEEVHKYITTLANISIVLQELRKVEECLYYTGKLRNFVKQKEVSFYLKTDTRALIFSYSTEMDLHIENGNIHEAIRLVPYFERLFEASGNEIAEYHKVGVYFTIANAFIIAANYKKALPWINKSLEGFSSRLDLQPAARLINILIHYELGNIHTLDTIIHSSEHFLKRKQKLYTYEKSILNDLKKIQHSNEPATKMKTLQRMKKSIKELFSNEFGKIALEYFNYSAWIDSKLENKPMVEILKRNSHSK